MHDHRPQPTQASQPCHGGRPEASATILPALWVEIVVDNTATGPLRTGSHFARRRTAITISAGNRIYVFWLLQEPWVLQTESERQEARSLLDRLREAVAARASQLGLSAQLRSDLAGLVPAPGSLLGPGGVMVSIDNFL